MQCFTLRTLALCNKCTKNKTTKKQRKHYFYHFFIKKMSSSIAIHFQLVICSHIGTCANDCGKLKDTKDTPDVSFKTG